MIKRILAFLYALISFQAYSLSLQFVSMSMKPGYSVIGLYGRINGVKGVFVSGDFAQRLSRQFGAQYSFSNQAIVATGVEVDQLFENVSYIQTYSGRSILIAQSDFTVAFQEMLYTQIEQGLVSGILEDKNLERKTRSTLSALDFAKDSAIVFVSENRTDLESQGLEKIKELFAHRRGFFFFN